MKKIILFLLISAGSFAQLHPYSLIHTELHVQPDWNTETVRGKSVITLKKNAAQSGDLVLNAKDFDINHLSGTNFVADYTYDGKQIKIASETIVTDTFSIEIDYIAKLSQPDTMSGRKGFYFVNSNDIYGNEVKQFYTHGQTSDNSFWFPTIDHPAQKHTQDIFVTLDTAFVSLSNGLLVATENHGNGVKTDHWQQTKPHANYLTMVAGGNFVKVTDPAFDRFELSYFVEPAYEHLIENIFGHTTEMVEFFEKLLGVEFPWDKYAQMVVQDFVTGGMENTSATLLSKSAVVNTIQGYESTTDKTLAHELLHQWFGNLVTPHDWSEVVLSEALASYGEYLWTAHKYGQAEADYNSTIEWLNYLDVFEEDDQPLIKNEYDHESELFGTDIYIKGAKVMHTLRKEVGDDNFFKALNIYLTDHAFQSVNLEGFKKAFELVHGKDLAWFFDQWFYRPYLPDLDVEVTEEYNQVLFRVEQNKYFLMDNYFEVDLGVKIITYESVIDTVFTLTAQTQEFVVQTDAPMTDYILNPDGSFPGVVFAKKSGSEFLRNIDHADETYTQLLALAMASNLEEDDELAESEITSYHKKLFKHDFWRFRQLAIEYFDDYNGEDFNEVEALLEEVISSDPSLDLRGEALLAVKNFMNPDHITLAREALLEDSYTLKAAALEFLFYNDRGDLSSLAEEYENSVSNDVFAAVMNYYIENEVPGKTDLILNRTKTLEGGEIYQYLGLLTAYLIAAEPHRIDDAIPFIKDVSIENQYLFVRFSGVTSLYSLQYYSELADEAFKEAVNHEVNTPLKDYFDND